VVGNDGDTHQGIFDLSYLSHIPNLNILAPKDFRELGEMLKFAYHLNLPVAIRYPRGAEGSVSFEKQEEMKLGKAEVLREGNDLTIVAIGKMVERAVQIADKLSPKQAEVINARFLKPLDVDTILKSANKTKKVFTVEDNVVKGGFGNSIRAILGSNIKVTCFGYPDSFIEHGNTEEIERLYELDVESLSRKILTSN
jgi:1-deoxy-D-xylulose-5-phosphate synthase